MDLTLLHAGLAAGAALAVVPVILHLFMKQTPKHVIFPALRLIRERHKRSKQKLRIKNWLLLLARMALVALMALALARPTLHSQASLGDRDVPTALGLVFDTSLSMQYTDRNETRLAEAKQRADDILKRTPESSHVFVLDSADPGLPPPLSPAAARKRIESLTLHPANRPLNAAIALAYRAVAESDRPRREVYVLTDLERTSWELSRPIEGLEAARKIKPPVFTYVLQLSPKEVYDAAVVAAEPTSGVVTQGEPMTIKVRLRAYGKEQNRLVEFYVDKDDKGRPLKRAQKTVAIPAGREAELEFTAPNLAIGLHQGEVRLGGTDPLEFDDRRYFSFEIKPAQHVLVVSDRIEDAVFVQQALDPVTLRNSGVRPFPVDRSRSEELERRAHESLRQYTCIFLLNVSQLGEAEWSKLNTYVREGGGLVVALGSRCLPDNYNSLVAGQMLPASLDRITKPKDEITFGKADFSHPLFNQHVRELDAALTGVPIFRYWKSTPVKGARTLLSYQDGSPALIERAFPGPKTGRVLLWTTPLARSPGDEKVASWNDFPRDWSFAYLTNLTVPYVNGLATERLNYEAGQDVVLPLDMTRRVGSYVVQGPDNRPPDRYTPLPTNPVLLIPAPGSMGQWSVTSTGAGAARATLGFSVNAPELETHLAAVEPAQLDSLFGKENYALANDTESLKRAEGFGRVGHELFPWIMALILALVTLENLLANKFYRERRAAAASPSAQAA